MTELKRLEAELAELATRDELTQLYDRRGFVMLAEHLLELQDRAGRNAALYVVALDDRQTIDDRYGDAEGDLALCDLANLLERTFHESDLIGKLDGDEFVALAFVTSPDAARQLQVALEQAIQAFNAARVRPYRLSASISLSLYDPQRPQPVERLLPEATRQLDSIKSRHGV